MNSFSTPPIAHAFAALHHLEALEDWHSCQPDDEGADLPSLDIAITLVRRYVEEHQALEQRQCNQWHYR